MFGAIKEPINILKTADKKSTLTLRLCSLQTVGNLKL